MQTYEISQYEKRLNMNSSSNNCSMKNTGLSSNFNYDTYFNMNLQKNVTFENFELEQLLRESEKESKKLRIENARLYDYIKTVEDRLDKKDSEMSMLNNEDKTLNEEKQEMNVIIQDQKDKLDSFQNELCSMNKQCNSLSNELNKTKKDLNNALKDNDIIQHEINQLEQNHSKKLNEVLNENRRLSNELKNRILQYEDEMSALKNQMEQLYLSNKNLQEENKRYQPLEEMNKQLQEENNQLKNENKTMFNNDNALIDDLKNQIDMLRNHASILEKEKKNIEKAKAMNKKTNEDIIKEGNNKIAQLEKDNEHLNKKAMDYKKLNQTLMKEKESLISQLNQLQNELQSLKPSSQSKSKLKSENLMLIECLKGENDELKYQLQKIKRITDMLLQFVNNLCALFEREEVNFDYCKDYPEYLQETLNGLEMEIERLLNDKNNSQDVKWKNIEDKLLYRPSDSLKQDQFQEPDGQNYKMGKCSACDLGCNTTLKGCNPLFAKKDLNPTNLPQNKVNN